MEHDRNERGEKGGTRDGNPGVYERQADGSYRPATPEPGSVMTAAAVWRWLGFLAVAVLLIVAMCSLVSCTGTRHVDVERDAFVNGTPAHPSLYDELKTELVECFRAQYAADTGARLTQPIRPEVPLDSMVREWVIVDKADDLAKYCARADGSVAGECWNLEAKRIVLARPAIETWTLPLHGMGHAVQGYFQIPGEPGGHPDESHGPKFAHCVDPS